MKHATEGGLHPSMYSISHRWIITATIFSATSLVFLASTSTASADNQPTDAKTEVSVEEKPAEAEVTYTNYQVQRGDYLERIAKKHSLSWPSIYEVNESISNPDLIHVGLELRIPSKDVALTRDVAQTTMAIPASYQQQAEKKVLPKVASSTKAEPKGAVVEPTVSYGGTRSIGNAWSMVGAPYVHGGSSPSGFDCSGFTSYIARQNGVTLPRTAMGQYNATSRLSQSQLQAGDLVFFNPGHVGLYVGGGKVIHATNPRQGVLVDTLAGAIKYNGYMGAGRY